MLTITDGTGRYDGASGSCNLNNQVTHLEFGTQEQFGAFTCDIALSTPP